MYSVRNAILSPNPLGHMDRHTRQTKQGLQRTTFLEDLYFADDLDLLASRPPQLTKS